MSIMHNGEKVLNNLTTVPITQTINASSTETQIPSAKAVNDKIDAVSNRIQPNAVMFRKENTSYSTLSELIQNHEFFKSSSTEEFIFSAEGFDDLPVTNWGFSIRLYTRTGNNYVVANMMLSNLFYTRYMKYDGTWDGGWQKVCTTRVADVPKTLITITDETNYKNTSGSESFYIVKNGICYVTLALDCVSPLSNTFIATLPKVDGGIFRFSTSKTNSTIIGYVLQNGELKLTGGNAGVTYYVCTFSYPVAES